MIEVMWKYRLGKKLQKEKHQEELDKQRKIPEHEHNFNN